MTIYSEIAAQAEQCKTCAELQRLAARSVPQLNALLAQVTAARDELAAAQELLTLNPADLPGVISFLGKLKTYVITPYLAPYEKYLTQIPEITAGIATATAALNAAANRIGNCSI
jgi:uncharacterized protein with von Willebrand factor type A (vWA) domain